MNPNVAALISRFCERGVLVDTNLLLVLLVGNVDPNLVGKVARTDGYDTVDYGTVRLLLLKFARIVVLPQILTEAGNLLKRNCRTQDTLYDLHRALGRFVLDPATLETRVASRSAVCHKAFHHAGFADSSILLAASRRYLLFTADEPLQALASGTGVAVLPFQWLKAN